MATRIIENSTVNRLQIRFDGKPSESIRTALKKSGFRWAPSIGVWQRQLTENARRDARRIVGSDAEAEAPRQRSEFEWVRPNAPRPVLTRPFSAPVEAAAALGSEIKVGFRWESPQGVKTIIEIRGDRAQVRTEGAFAPKISKLDDLQQDIARDRMSMEAAAGRERLAASEAPRSKIVVPQIAPMTGMTPLGLPETVAPSAERQPTERVLAVPPEEARRIFKARPLISQNRDKGRRAKTVAPAKASNKREKRLQQRWKRDPSKLDYEGIDAPEGTPATQLAARVARKVAAVTPVAPVVAEALTPAELADAALERARARAALAATPPSSEAATPSSAVLTPDMIARFDMLGALAYQNGEAGGDGVLTDEVSTILANAGITRPQSIQQAYRSFNTGYKNARDNDPNAEPTKEDATLLAEVAEADIKLLEAGVLDPEDVSRLAVVETATELDPADLTEDEILERAAALEQEGILRRIEEERKAEAQLPQQRPPLSNEQLRILRGTGDPIAIAVGEIDTFGNANYEGFNVKVVGTNSGNWTTELIDTRSVRHYDSTEYGSLDEARDAALKHLVEGTINGLDLKVTPLSDAPILEPGELAVIGAEAREVLQNTGIAVAKGIEVKVIKDPISDNFVVEMLAQHGDMPVAERHIMSGEFDSVEEANEAALRHLTNALIEQETRVLGGAPELTEEAIQERAKALEEELGEEVFGLMPEMEELPHAETAPQRQGIEGVRSEILPGFEAEGVPSVTEGRDVATGLGLEGAGSEGLRGEPDSDRNVRETGVVVGDTAGDIGDQPGLTIAPLPFVGNDYILNPSDLDHTISPAVRFDANLDAVRLVKRLEEEGRQATPEEQIILARFSGWGDSAFNNAFPKTRGYSRDDSFKNRGEVLRELVTPEEYEAIEVSRLNAFYTTPAIVQAMWKGLEQLGANDLARPRILEPSAGSGRFIGLQPVEMAAKSQRTAVELDTITGNILTHLFPNAATYVTGFQSAPIPDDSIDIAISNVPFGNFPVFDPAFRSKARNRLTKQIHNYFFAKTLDKLRPGGVLAFITSHGTLDAPTSQTVRESLAEQADLISAVRLPKGAFPDTEVVTDIIFMRKRLPGEEPGDQSWVKSTTVKIPLERWPYEVEVDINNYYLEHPEQVMGEHTAGGTMRGRDEYAVELSEGSDLLAMLDERMRALPANSIQNVAIIDQPRSGRKFSPSNVRNHSYVVNEEGKLEIKEGYVLVETSISATDTEKIVEMLGIRDAARAALKAQMDDLPVEEIEAAQSNLNSVYDAFQAKNGALNSKENIKLMGNDPDAPLLRALEFEANNKWNKMPIFSERVISGLGQHDATTALDALSIVLNEIGTLDFDRMAELLGKSAAEVQAELSQQRVIFKNPLGGWEQSDDYLSGNVREKLAAARIAATRDSNFQSNVEALELVIPKDLEPSEIYAQVGSPWVPDTDINAFTSFLIGGYRSYRSNDNYFTYNPTLAKWDRNITTGKVDANRAKMTIEFGTPDMPALEIIDRLLNSKKIEVTMPDPAGGDKRVRDEKGSIQAQEKANLIQEKFVEWLWNDTERAERLARFYNDHYNNVVARNYDGSHLTFPGMSTEWAKRLHSHQRDAIWRVTQDGTTLLAHEVGFGKTAVLAASGMELRRLGLSRKNIFVVPKATHAQFTNQFRELYPYAKVLSPDKDDFTPKKRPEFVSRIATGDWDAVIIADSQFTQLPMSPAGQMKFMQEELRELRGAIESEVNANGKSRTHKELMKALVTLEANMLKTQAKLGDRADDTLYFEDLGIDQLFVDEADRYKNLQFITRRDRIKGLPNTKSDRAWDMYQKVRHLQKTGNGRGVVFATGTPVANSIAELYTMMRYLQSPLLEAEGIDKFDAWAQTFGATTESLEQTPAGAYRVTSRFAKFNNLPELNALWQQTADIRVTSEVPEITKLQPKIVNAAGEETRETVAASRSEELARYMDELGQRAENLKDVDPTEDNMLKISSDARKASLDIRLVRPNAPEDLDGKVARAIANITSIYAETTPDKGTQLLFLDLGTPKAKDKVSEDTGQTEEDSETGSEQTLTTSVYEDIKRKLIQRGIPSEEIAFIHDAKTDVQRNALFRKVNAGDIRVVIGSTEKMGVGVNVQQRAAALHHLDAPWRPRDIEQREGRVIRPGNKVYGPKLDAENNVLDAGKGVRIFNYVTEGSFDAYMWQAIEAKAKAIKALLRRNVTARTIDDADELVLSASEAKALASGNPDVMTAVKLKNDIHRLQIVAASRNDQKLRAALMLNSLPKQIAANEVLLADINEDLNLAEKNSEFSFKLGQKSIPEKDKAGEALAEVLSKVQPFDLEKTVGEYRGFKVNVLHPHDGLRIILKGKSDYVSNPISEITPTGVMTRLENMVKGIASKVITTQAELKQASDLLQGFQSQTDAPSEDDERLMRLKNELSVIEHRLAGTEETPAEAEGFTMPPDVSEYANNENFGQEPIGGPPAERQRMPVFSNVALSSAERIMAARERLAATQSRL